MFLGEGNCSGLLEKIPDFSDRGVVAVDSNGCIIYWNPLAEKIFGYNKQEAIGQYVHSLLVPENLLSACNECFKTFRESGRRKVIGKNMILRARSKSGEEFEVKLRLEEIQESDRWFVVGFVEIINLNFSAQESISLGTLEELFKNFRHDMGNILSGAYGYLSLIQLASGDEAQKKYAKKAEDCVQAVEERIRDLATLLIKKQ